MKGFLTQEFFDNAWPHWQREYYGGRVSANFEFVESARKSGFDLNNELRIKRSQEDSNYDFVAIVPFDTLSYHPIAYSHWHGIIPLHSKEVNIIDETG